MALLNPYLNFPGTAREAMTFYAEVFGGDLQVMTVGESMGADAPNADQVMHSHLSTPSGFTLMASDMAEADAPATRMNIVVSGTEADELRGYWEKLKDGAEIRMPLEKQMWGDEYGDLVDRFGIPWAINIGDDDQG